MKTAPIGVDVAKGNEAGAKKAGFNVVIDEKLYPPLRPISPRW